MIKKLILACSLAVLWQISFAETCPTVSEIKNNHMRGWQIYDSDDGKPLSSARELDFKKSIEQFALAEWSTIEGKNSSIHCYYRDNAGSSLEAYIAKDHYIPKIAANNFWYKVSGFMHCAAGMEKCQFENHALVKNQLARK